ncbi:MAG TPA: transglutaminase family protein [Caldimonas sp.]|jgi:transglutaminase-like putative cysteine protease|nr:transglutaminase family protein [Caldimonas sp.]
MSVDGMAADPASVATAAAASVRYDVEHETRYAYRVPVSQSWQLAHLTPCRLPWQRLVAHELAIEPPPDERHEMRDAFGNSVTHFGVHGPHPLLRVRMLCEVEISDRPDPAVRPALAWEAVLESLLDEPAQDGLRAVRMAEPSTLVPWSDAAHAYAAPSFGAGRDWLEAVSDVMRRIHGDFEFDPETTTVTTSVDEVLAQRSGVCQDFAHVMLACLRSHGLPARYVSGYLLTQPPPGRPRLLGADASHAWVAAYSPNHGWVELDPTNDTLADRRYITLATGADFADVVPLRGVILGGRGQTMKVAVSVVPR